MVHEKLAGDETFNASVRQIYDKLNKLLLINTVASTVSYLPFWGWWGGGGVSECEIIWKIEERYSYSYILLLSLIDVETCKRLDLNFTLTAKFF